MNKALKTSLMTLLVFTMVAQGHRSESLWSRIKAFFRKPGTVNRSIAEKVFLLVNQHRTSNNLLALTWNENAYKTALSHTTLMAKHRKDTKYKSAEKLQQLGGSAKLSTLLRKSANTNEDTVANEIFNQWKNNFRDTANVLDDKARYGAIAVRYVKKAKSYFASFVTQAQLPGQTAGSINVSVQVPSPQNTSQNAPGSSTSSSIESPLN